MPIESMMLIEARVLGGDNGVLKIGRDLAERNEFVARPIRLAVDKGLQAALDVDGGCRWVDPSHGHKRERGKRPKKRDSDREPSDQGSKRRSERTLAKRRLDVCVGPFSHTSE